MPTASYLPKVEFAWRVKKLANGKYTLTDNGDEVALEWATRADARAALNRAKDKAEKIARLGFFQTSVHNEIWIRIDRERIDLVLPYGFTPGDRTKVIRQAATQYYVDQEAGS